MFVVVAVDRNWAIGKNGGLLYRIPHDMANFRELTIGKTIVYGRKTLETFPDKKPLEGRKNIILTHDNSFTYEGATILHSVKELKEELEKTKDRNVYVIGGESIYRQLYNDCQYAFVTHIDNVTLDCDAFFPDIIKEGWQEVTTTPTLQYKGLPYRFASYKNPKL